MLIEGTTIKVPGPKPGAPEIVLQLGDIMIAEQRQNEIARVTPIKAPELLSLFNGAWRDVDKLVKELTEARIQAERQLERRRASLLLYEVEEILKKCDLNSTKDTRDAAIALDEAYQELQDRVDQITAAGEYLKGKLKSFENAFTSVKKIMGEDVYNMSTRIGNPNLSGTTDRPRAAPAQTTPPTSTTRAGWGKPRYNR
jgi:hypothetical protein